MDKYVSRYPESLLKTKSEAPQREKTNGNSSNFNNSTLVDINSTPQWSYLCLSSPEFDERGN